MLRHRARGPYLALLTIASFVLAGMGARASQVYALTGKFVSNQGRFLNSPLIGDVACPSIVLFSDGPPGTAGYNPRPANTYGCIPAKGKVTTTGKGVGGAFVMPPNVFAQPAQSSNGLPKHWLPVRNAVPLKQISTSDAFLGPPVARTLPAGQYANGMNTAAFRLFRVDAWSTQTGRLGSQFTWCPGGCTTDQQRGVVKYFPRQNRFGGTMSLLISPGPNGSQLVLQAGGPGITTGTMGSMLGNVIFAPFGSYATQATGAGYVVKRTQIAGPASVFAKYMTAMTSLMRITMGTSFVGTLPPDGRQQVGFPWTTGTVVVRYRINGGSTTLTAKGGDEITSMGVRNLSLVAGGITLASESPLVSGIANMSQLLLPEPGGAALLTGVATLLGIAAARRQRR